MRSNTAAAIAFLSGAVFCSGMFADDLIDSLDLDEATVAASKVEPKPAPEIKERTVSVVQNITMIDVTALRKRLAVVQAEHASLYTGNELIALIEQTEQAVVDRKAKLAEKQKEFDAKLASIQVQLEELRETAAAVGADVSLELMVTAAKNSKKAEGRPLVKPQASPRSSDSFVPDFLDSGLDQLPQFQPNSPVNDFGFPTNPGPIETF